MSFLSQSTLGGSTDNFTVMFDDLSDDAQTKIASLDNLDSCWEMLPLAHLYESKLTLDQAALDDAALLTVGYYQ